MNKKQKEKLEEYIEMGKWNYVLMYGSRYAILMFIASWMYVEFVAKGEFWVGMEMIVWGIAGLIIGLWGWSHINKKLKEDKKK